jgi:hypothetical protein
MQERGGRSDNEAEQRYRGDDDHESSAFHGTESMLMDEGPSGQRRILPC